MAPHHAPTGGTSVAGGLVTERAPDHLPVQKSSESSSAKMSLMSMPESLPSPPSPPPLLSPPSRSSESSSPSSSSSPSTYSRRGVRYVLISFSFDVSSRICLPISFPM